MIAGLLTTSATDWAVESVDPWLAGWAFMLTTGGYTIVPVLLMILVRGKYPRWWFDWNLELSRFEGRLFAYLALLRDEYPSTDDQAGRPSGYRLPRRGTGSQSLASVDQVGARNSALCRADAAGLLKEIQDLLHRYPTFIKNAAKSADDGERIDWICDLLGEARNSLREL